MTKSKGTKVEEASKSVRRSPRTASKRKIISPSKRSDDDDAFIVAPPKMKKV